MNKSDKVEFPQTLQEAIVYFADEQRALDFMVSLRWAGGKVACPHCQGEKVSFLTTRKKWKCMNPECHKQFSAKSGTVMEDSPLPYSTWFPAFWLIANAKNGISSYEIHRALGITQKSAWFLLHRIRLALQNGTIVKMGGTVEVDESFIGGAARFMHKSRRKAKSIKTGPSHLTAVQGLLERHGKGKSRIVLKVMKNRREIEATKHVKEYVLKGSHVYTDKLASYQNLGKFDYEHKVIDHAEKYVDGVVHTNGLENFWSLLKRGIRGTYVSVEPFHLFRYLDEQAFRFNEREDNDAGRFMKAVAGLLGKSLTFTKLTGKDGGGELLRA